MRHRVQLARQENVTDIALISVVILIFCLRIWDVGIVHSDDAAWAVEAHNAGSSTATYWAVTQGRLYAFPYGALMLHAIARFGTTYGELLRVGSFAVFFIAFHAFVAVYWGRRLAILTCCCFLSFFSLRWEASWLTAGPLAPWVMGSAFLASLLLARAYAKTGRTALAVATGLSLFASFFHNEGITLLFGAIFLLAVVWIALDSFGAPFGLRHTFSVLTRPGPPRTLLATLAISALAYIVTAGGWRIAYPSHYDGHIFAPFDLAKFSATLLQFSTGNLFLRDLFQPYSLNFDDALTKSAMLSIYKPSTYLRALIWDPAAVMFGFIIALAFWRSSHRRSRNSVTGSSLVSAEIFALIAGLTIAILPIAPVAATAKYQEYLRYGVASYNASIIPYFGISLTLAAIFTLITKTVREQWRSALASVMALGIGIAAATSSRMNDAIAADMRLEGGRWRVVALALEAAESAQMSVKAVWAPRFRSGSGFTREPTHYWSDYAKARYKADLHFLDLMPPPEKLEGMAYLDYFLADDDRSFVVAIARLRPTAPASALRGTADKIVINIQRPNATLLRTFWISFLDNQGLLHQIPLGRLPPGDRNGRIRILDNVSAVPGTIQIVRQAIIEHWPDSCSVSENIQHTIDIGTRSVAKDWGCSSEVVLGAGWGPVETRGVWSSSTQARLSIATAGLPRTRLELAFDLSTYTGMGFYHGTQTVHVSLNDRPMASWTFGPGLPAPDTRLVVPEDLVNSSATLEVAFEIDRPMNPKKLGVANDDRELGITLRAIKLNSGTR